VTAQLATPPTLKDKPVNWIGFLYIALTIAFTVYGQMVIKWQVNQAGEFPPDTGEKIIFIIKLLLTPWIMSGFASAFIASIFWMAAMTQFDISFAYPFMSLSYVIVMVLSFLLMGEKLTPYKIVGTLVIIAGLFIVTRK
jgi:drug/metabolite transporter (DMT)-like permease